MEGTLVYVNRSLRRIGGWSLATDWEEGWTGSLPRCPHHALRLRGFVLFCYYQRGPLPHPQRMLLPRMVGLGLCFSVLQACARL